MLGWKHANGAIAAVTAIAVSLCLVLMLLPNRVTEALDKAGVTMEYEEKLFETDGPIDIDILMDDDQWEDMLANALSEEYYACDIAVNGTVFENVGIRTKGNTSLSNIAKDDTTDRYSFKVEFDHYVKDQTCFGLDKLVLNNGYADATSMKEALVYDMFAYLGADASLCNYAKISVNGEYWGVYLALEAVEESFLLRTYGVTDGNLYKPETMNIGGDQKDDHLENPQLPDGGERPGGENAPQLPDDGERPGGEAAPGGKDGNGADLNYVSEDAADYSAIWDSAAGTVTEADQERVITALKHISSQEDVETYLDVDNMLRYLAVQTFVVNLDSLSGTMAHNYYLYESDGQLNMIPWDYNLAWGGYTGGGSADGSNAAGDTVNFAIDTPFSSGITLEDREFFAALLEQESYLDTYHAYLQKLCDYVQNGELDKTTERIHSQIDELIAQDPNAFYTYEEYEAANEMLMQVLSLRAESVQGQLYGTIPSTNEGQAADTSSLIDASGLNLQLMGTMNQGGGMQGNLQGNMSGNRPGERPENAEDWENSPKNPSSDAKNAENDK